MVYGDMATLSSGSVGARALHVNARAAASACRLFVPSHAGEYSQQCHC